MKKLMLLAIAALMLFSCSKEDRVSAVKAERTGNQITKFYATTEGSPVPGSKVYADENLRLLWNENDYISIGRVTNMIKGIYGKGGGQ